MTIDEFRKHKYLPQQWRKELETNGILQLVLQVMMDNSPENYAIARNGNDDISPTQAAIELGVTRGYAKYAGRLKVLSLPMTPSQSVGEPTYERPEREEKHA